MYHIVIYKDLSYNQKQNIKTFIKENFSHLHYDGFGLELQTIIILYVENNKIIGCVCLLNNRILKNILINANVDLKKYNFDYGNGLYLYNLCVDTNFRNKHIGSELVNNALNLCKEIKIDYIHAQAENEISRNLFLKKGFMEDNNFVGPSKNTIYVMSKFI